MRAGAGAGPAESKHQTRIRTCRDLEALHYAGDGRPVHLKFLLHEVLHLEDVVRPAVCRRIRHRARLADMFQLLGVHCSELETLLAAAEVCVERVSRMKQRRGS